MKVSPTTSIIARFAAVFHVSPWSYVLVLQLTTPESKVAGQKDLLLAEIVAAGPVGRHTVRQHTRAIRDVLRCCRRGSDTGCARRAYVRGRRVHCLVHPRLRSTQLIRTVHDDMRMTVVFQSGHQLAWAELSTTAVMRGLEV